MGSKTSAGTTLGISATAPATFDEAGFGAIVATEIGEVTNIDGQIGRSYNTTNHNPLKTRATVKKKGSFNSGNVTVSLAIDREDAGQALVKTALKSDNDYSFVLTEQDGSKVYFRGLVTAFTTTPGSVDSISAGSITIEITANDDGDDFVEVPAD